MAWDCLGKGDRFLGTCATLSSLATFTWEPWGNEQFRSAPKPLLWLKTPKLLLLGKKQEPAEGVELLTVLGLTHIPDSHLA